MIANACPVPLILYNVPSRTGSNMDAETTLELAHDVRNIIGIKEASGNLEKVMRILHGRPKDFLVISGDDLLTLPMLACGADGVISVIANAFPKDWSEMVRAGLKVILTDLENCTINCRRSPVPFCRRKSVRSQRVAQFSERLCRACPASIGIGR